MKPDYPVEMEMEASESLTLRQAVGGKDDKVYLSVTKSVSIKELEFLSSIRPFVIFPWKNIKSLTTTRISQLKTVNNKLTSQSACGQKAVT